MKSLNNYIVESIESDYLLWQLGQWFKQYENEEQEFINIVLNCIKDHTTNNLEKYVEETSNFKIHLKDFITFVLDDIDLTTNKEIDYIYQLKQIVQQLINNKSSKNKYNK